MLKYFGTDGFRGEAGVNLNADHAYKIGRFLGWFYKDSEEKVVKVAIGKDTRRSSYMFEYAIAAGLTASGAEAYMLHVTTTPSVSYVVNQDGFDCGVMISASHNPFHDNGIKLVNSNGEKMEESVLVEIEKYLDGDLDALGLSDDIPYAKGDKIGRIIDWSEGRNRYVGYLISVCLYSYKGFKIALDCANGSSWMIAKSVFDALGAKTYCMGNTPNGVNINRECGSTDTRALREFVVEKGCDVGFAFDGDADRCIAVDETGREIDGDLIMWTLALEMRRRGQLVNDTVVTTVMSNYGLHKAFQKEGIKCEVTQVGDKWVWENMARTNNALGGENSGHIILKKYATTGDGILTAIKVMEVVVSQKTRLSELVKPVKLLAQKTVNVKVLSKKEVLENARVLEKVEEIKTNLENRGRILLRESGTEPVVRIMTECESIEECTSLCESVRKIIEEEGLSV